MLQDITVITGAKCSMQMLFRAFKEIGDIFNQVVAARFEKEILSRGGTRDPLDMYIAFRGKEPGIDALLVNRGLK